MTTTKPTYSLCLACKKPHDKRFYHGKYCEGCGSLLIQKCPNDACGTEIKSDGAQFCRECGTSYYGKPTQK